MSGTAVLRQFLKVDKGNLHHRTSQPDAFQLTVTGARGPCGGEYSVNSNVEANLFNGAGSFVSPDLHLLTTPGIIRITNLDPTNFITVGILDIVNNILHLLEELLPGEHYTTILTPGFQYGGLAGTNVIAALGLSADTAPCLVKVEVFDA